MGKIFITSDTFFGRKSIIKKAKRPFETVEEMNKTLINNWNSVVSPGDIVYHLGNFAWDPLTAESVLSELNGEIRFVLGEYDDALLEVHEYVDLVTILEGDIIEDYDLGAIISHWPLERWKNKHKGVYHYHGSTLRGLKTDLKKMNRVNVCCDNWNFKPQSIENLQDMFKDWKDSNKTQKKIKNNS